VCVTNANPFPITGTLTARASGRALPAKAFRVGPGAARTVTLGVPARRRPVRARLVARVLDPAGHVRTVRGISPGSGPRR
jgi:hypothetical protein